MICTLLCAFLLGNWDEVDTLKSSGICPDWYILLSKISSFSFVFAPATLITSTGIPSIPTAFLFPAFLIAASSSLMMINKMEIFHRSMQCDKIIKLQFNHEFTTHSGTEPQNAHFSWKKLFHQVKKVGCTLLWSSAKCASAYCFWSLGIGVLKLIEVVNKLMN